MEKYSKLIRNFSIIAHIDHGKSTLADRFIENTGAVAKKDLQEQMLDTLDLERKRGITIKLNAIKLNYVAKDGKTYILNLIDTPGHVDFRYEVSRSLASCEGAILVVDGTQGIQAQTLSNIDLALENDLDIFPVINKVDLDSCNVAKTKKEIEKYIGLNSNNIPLISAKNNINVDKVLEKIISDFPSPGGNDKKPLKALIFDSYYDQYKGVMLSIRIFEGTISVNDLTLMLHTKTKSKITNIFQKTPFLTPVQKLRAGEVGIISGNIKDISKIRIGDTITNANNPCKSIIKGYKEIMPVVYSSLYPVDNDDYEILNTSLKKIKINDDSLQYEQEFNQALGFGYRCGFLGMLHLEVIKERLETEYGLNLIVTFPSVKYKIVLVSNKTIIIDNPGKLPAPQKIKDIYEPYTYVKIILPKEYLGKIMQYTIEEKRGKLIKIDIIDDDTSILEFHLPLNELIMNYFDTIKSISKGYASIDYKITDYKKNKLVKLNILINNNVVDPLSVIIHKDKAYNKGKVICKKIKELIPRHNFEIPIQAAINKTIISRQTIKANRKNVLSKCYGGDISRKRKLLEKQKAGKKKLKMLGNVNVPQEVFLNILKTD